MNRKVHAVLTLVVLLAVFIAIPLSVNATHAWGNFHWARSANPFSLDLGDNVSNDWWPSLDKASDDWSLSIVLDTTVVPGEAKRNCRPTAGRIEVCSNAYGYTGWLGVAQIWASGDYITQATTKVNDTYFSSAPYNTPAWRHFVMCQEIGHDFGLDHQDEDFNNSNLDSCMDYTSDPTSNQHPNAHDYDQLETIYTHLDTPAGGGGCNPRSPKCNAGKNGAANGDLHSRAEWGQLVRTQGRTAVYERDFGHGNKVITFVIWAD